jgi:hypothetical protein
MKQASLLTSTAAGVIIGALVFGASPAVSQMMVVDWASIAVQQIMKTLQDQISNTLKSITGQLGLTGPLGSILGDSTYGTTNQLLRDGFTQNANYSKAQISAQQQITDASLLASTRVKRDFRNAQIRDEHTLNSVHCAAIDHAQAVTVGAGQSWKVATSIEGVANDRRRAVKGQPAYYGSAQAGQALTKLHLSRYCSEEEAASGLCTKSQTPDADQDASSLFGTGTYNGQDGVDAANAFVTNAIEPIVPAAIRGDQLTSATGADAMLRRREYNARMSLAQTVLIEQIASQSPSIPLNAAQKQQMTNEGLPPIDTGSWLQALTLDVHRRYSDVNWAAQLQSMPPAAVQREIAIELAATNYLLLENYRIATRNASVNATHLAATVEQNFQPAVQMPTPNMAAQ